MRIAVCIPTFKGHLSVLPQTLLSVAAQTRQPDLVLVRASSCEEKELAAAAAAATPATEQSTPLQLLSTPAYQNAAQNRNAMLNALPADITHVMMIDSDDIMHAQCLSFLEMAFADGATGLVQFGTLKGYRADLPHEWTEQRWAAPTLNKNDVEIYFELMQSGITEKYIPFYRTRSSKNLSTTFGNIGISLKELGALRYDPTAFGYEDAKFVSEYCMRDDMKHAFIEEPLLYACLTEPERFIEKSMNLLQNLMPNAP